MSSVDDVATLDELAVRVGSRERAVELLARLNVPVTEGVFSDRLFRSRLEQGERASQDPVDAAANHLARLGLIAARVDRGHPTVLTMTAAYPLALGSPEFSVGDPFVPMARLTLAPGERMPFFLQLCSRRGPSTADFNVQMEARVRKSVSAPFYALYCVSEDRMWLVKRAELEHFRDMHDPAARTPERGSRTFTFFPLTKPAGYWRLAFSKSPSDFDAAYRVQRVEEVPPASEPPHVRRRARAKIGRPK